MDTIIWQLLLLVYLAVLVTIGFYGLAYSFDHAARWDKWVFLTWVVFAVLWPLVGMAVLVNAWLYSRWERHGS